MFRSSIIALLLSLFACPAFAAPADDTPKAVAPQAETGRETPLNSTSLPTTLDAVVADIVAGLSEQDKETLRTTRREDLINFHFGWGMGIRNHYRLWGGNEELLRSVCGGEPCHPDSASMIIIENVWEAVRGTQAEAVPVPHS